MHLLLSFALAAAILTFGALPTPAQQYAPGSSTGYGLPQVPLDTGRPKEARRAAATAQDGQIACTFTGCVRIPRRCHPEMGYSQDGTPTGFDIVICP